MLADSVIYMMCVRVHWREYMRKTAHKFRSGCSVDRFAPVCLDAFTVNHWQSVNSSEQTKGFASCVKLKTAKGDMYGDSALQWLSHSLIILVAFHDTRDLLPHSN